MLSLSKAVGRRAYKYSIYRSVSTIVYDSSLTSSCPEKIISECLKYREAVQPLNDKTKGPLEKLAQKNTILPFVFLLGNHSSGKSSFINYVCGRKVQTAGVAPTDDSFTCIVPGPTDSDRDGLAFIGDPDMGFSGLRSFGPQLIHHTQLKVRENIAFQNFMLVDTPGMIDSPMVSDSQGRPKQAVMDRGYDFAKVCKWYADRADVILLFFDPDKPGTTGETLSVLTSSLIGLDHKLYIILNKADQFRKIHDFARAYGSLCWNLSKVIHRKDLPRIYTMCLPSNFRAKGSGDQSDDGSSLGQGLVDLETTREEVLLEVLNAPKRRVDNEISRLSESMSLLQMHCNVINEIRSRYNTLVWRNRLSLLTSSALSVAIPTACFTLSVPIEVVVSTSSIGIIGTGILAWYSNEKANKLSKELISENSLQKIYQNLYARRIHDDDAYTSSLWIRVRDHLLMELSSSDVQTLPSVSSSEIRNMEDIINRDIPTLRRSAAPLFNK